MLGILVGLKAEARLIRPYYPDAPIVLSGATSVGAQYGVERLVASGVTSLLSFGCAAGLAPGLVPGCIVVPNWVTVDGFRVKTDEDLCRSYRVERSGALEGGILHSDSIVGTSIQKARLYDQSGCLAADMESGFVAKAKLPFAVLRVICDDSRRDLPPAAYQALACGRISPLGLVKSIARQPSQIPSLIALGFDASRAHRAMARFLFQTRSKYEEGSCHRL